MGDFGRILDEWESMRRGRRRNGGAPQGNDERSRAHREWFERQLSRYPVVDKDAGHEARGDDAGSAPEQLPVEDTIDLHGLTVQEALAATERFIAQAARRGLRKVLVIHGKGRNGDGVLRREVRAYLERDPRAGAMGYAPGNQGGRGALWVVVRRKER